MDETCYEILSCLRLENVDLIKLFEFEDKELLKVKPGRTLGEYCWTCTPSLPLFIFRKFSYVDVISYLDADLCFFSSSEPIFEEMGNKSIMIIPHRFSSMRKLKEKMNGKYNVGMLTFRRDANGIKCLKWWRNECLKWCFYKFEDGKIGDQKYLDQFPKLFSGVHVLKNIGAGVGVWNVRQYLVTKKYGAVYINDHPLIFFHFADFEIYSPIPFLLPAPLLGYGEISKNRDLIYDQYFRLVYETLSEVCKFYPNFDFGLSPRPMPKYIKDAVIEKIVYLRRAGTQRISSLFT